MSVHILLLYYFINYVHLISRYRNHYIFTKEVTSKENEVFCFFLKHFLLKHIFITIYFYYLVFFMYYNRCAVDPKYNVIPVQQACWRALLYILGESKYCVLLLQAATTTSCSKIFIFLHLQILSGLRIFSQYVICTVQRQTVIQLSTVINLSTVIQLSTVI